MLCARGMQRNAHIELEYSQDDVAVVSVGIQVLLELYGNCSSMIDATNRSRLKSCALVANCREVCA